MEPESSLQHSQVTATCPYHEPHRSSQYPHALHAPSILFFSINHPNNIGYQKKLWNGAHQEEENEVDLNLPGRKGLEDWWEKRD